MKRIRALLVDDSATVRHRLREVLERDPEIEVVGEGADGKQAIDLCLQLRPDVLSLDMLLPVMSGLAATEYIMAHQPTPILIVSSSFNRGELFKTYDALAAGAVDVFEKPNGNEPSGEWERGYLAAMKMASRIKVITHPRARLNAATSRGATPSPPTLESGHRKYRAVALGASTGGPAALTSVLKQLPTRLEVPVFFVLHIDEPFAASFAEWLSAEIQHPVSTPADGESVSKLVGRVVMAPAGRHLTVSGGRVWLTNGPERHSCKPSVDVLFESVASEYGSAVVAALLTGMGRDGAAGLLAIRRAGGSTIAQSEETCVVYGMPREAARLGAADRVLALPQIGRAIHEQLLADSEETP